MEMSGSERVHARRGGGRTGVTYGRERGSQLGKQAISLSGEGGGTGTGGSARPSRG